MMQADRLAIIASPPTSLNSLESVIDNTSS